VTRGERPVSTLNTENLRLNVTARDYCIALWTTILHFLVVSSEQTDLQKWTLAVMDGREMTIVKQ
jgi:hypothetical protein